MKESLLLTSWFAAAMLLGISACNNPKPAGKATATKDSIGRHLAHAAQDLAGNFSNQSTLLFDSVELSPFFSRYPSLRSFENDMRSFYRKRHFSCAWYDANGQIEQATSLHMRLRDLPAEGITTPVPYLVTLDSLMAGAPEQEPALRTETELLLSGLYFFYAGKVWAGLPASKTSDLEWFMPRKKLSYQSVLDSMLRTGSAFADADEPVYRQYNLLKPFLKKYQEMEQAHAWEKIGGLKNSYRPGDSSATIVQLRKRLWLTGDLAGDTTTAQFDAALEADVKKFQHPLWHEGRRHHRTSIAAATQYAVAAKPSNHTGKYGAQPLAAPARRW